MKIEDSSYPASDLMNVDEAAAYLRITKTQLYDLTSSRGTARAIHPIPVIRMGTKSLRFRKGSLDAWLTSLEKAG